MKKLITSILGAIALLAWANAFALTAGQTYTISVEKVNSNGSVTSGATSLGLSTTATADSSGKVAFSFTSSIPTTSSCNFLVITITDSLGAIARKAIAPCPASASTEPLGVSGVTYKQSDALLAAFQAAGTDDPILAVFGFAIVRSGNMSALDVAAMADVCYQGIYNTGGFIDYLKTRSGTTNGVANAVTDAQLLTYRSNIVTQLGDASSGYTKLMKDSVDAADSTTGSSKRGKAAGLVLKTLITAADGVFPQDYIMEAFNAMGSIAVPLMTSKVSGGTLSATGASMVQAGIGGGLQKLQADRSIEKYNAAMTLMGASGADLTQFSNAVSTLRTAMDTAFSQFEDVFSEDDHGANGDIDGKNTTFQSTMQAAFMQYMTDMAASDARITTMRTGIQSVTGGAAPPAQFFKFNGNGGGQSNWPINMVVLAQWGTTIAQAGGSLSYTQDTNADVPIPNQLQQFMGVCSDPAYSYGQQACTGSGGTWTVQRRNFASNTFVPSSFPYGHLMNIQQDMMIREFKRFSENSGDNDRREAAEKSFTDGLFSLVDHISGTTNGTTPISFNQKKAMVTLMQSPQF